MSTDNGGRIVACVVAFGGVMLFLFVPETFWNRSPSPKPKDTARPNFIRRLSSRYGDSHHAPAPPPNPTLAPTLDQGESAAALTKPTLTFETGEKESGRGNSAEDDGEAGAGNHRVGFVLADRQDTSSRYSEGRGLKTSTHSAVPPAATSSSDIIATPAKAVTSEQGSHASDVEKGDLSYKTVNRGCNDSVPQRAGEPDPEKADAERAAAHTGTDYTAALREQPPQTFTQQLRPYHGRLNPDNWFEVLLRPFVLFSYPAILWSSAVYSCSVGWLIVISEALAMIYQESARGGYSFTPLQTGLVYISPFIGGLLGTAVAGRVSDIVVKAMSRRNGGLYEPEFRLVMGIPILITTVMGLIGFGWSAEERDHWIVPTVFFGIISFGCSLGSTTSITFCVDSYRQYAGEALVTLNFSKNIFHGLVFSLFFTHWMSEDGSKTVFMWTGIIQLVLMLTTIPLYIYGKRLRMWTVRKNFVERLNKT